MIFLFRHPAMIVYKNITCEVERHQYWDVPISLYFTLDWGPWSDWSKNSACFCHNEIWDMDTWWSGEALALNTILAADYQIRISTLFESPSHPFICKSVVSKCTVYYVQCTVLSCTVLYCTVVPGLVSVSVCRVIMRHMCPSGRAPGCQSLLEILKTRHSSPSPGPWPSSCLSASHIITIESSEIWQKLVWQTDLNLSEILTQKCSASLWSDLPDNYLQLMMSQSHLC